MDVFLEVVSTSPGGEGTLQSEVSTLLWLLLDPLDAGREGDFHQPARAAQHLIHVPFSLSSSFIFCEMHGASPTAASPQMNRVCLPAVHWSSRAARPWCHICLQTSAETTRAKGMNVCFFWWRRSCKGEGLWGGQGSWRVQVVVPGWKALDAPLSARRGRAAPLRGQCLCESPSKQMKFHTTQISEFKKGREVGRGAGEEEGEGGRSCGLAGCQRLMLTPRGRWHPSLVFPLLPALPAPFHCACVFWRHRALSGAVYSTMVCSLSPHLPAHPVSASLLSLF